MNTPKEELSEGIRKAMNRYAVTHNATAYSEDFADAFEKYVDARLNDPATANKIDRELGKKFNERLDKSMGGQS